jgi:hypothetical protein
MAMIRISRPGTGRAAASLAGSPFPALDCHTLDGAPMRLPTSLDGRPALLMLGLSPFAAGDAEAWARWAAQRYAGTPLQLYLVVVVEGPRFLAPVIDGIFRAQTDPALRAHALTAYDPKKATRARLGVTRDRRTQLYLLDAHGRIAWSAGEGFAPERASELARQVEGLPQAIEAPAGRAPSRG